MSRIEKLHGMVVIPIFLLFFSRLVGHMVCEVGLVCLNPL